MMKSSQNNFIGHALQAIWLHKYLIFLVVVLVVVSGMLVTFLITPKYEASMSVLVSRDKVENQVTPGEGGSGMILQAISDEEFNSELELLQSNEVLVGAVKEMASVKYDVPPTMNNWIARYRELVKNRINSIFGEKKKNELTKDSQMSLENEVKRVAAGLDVVPVKKSRIIKVTYQDVDPIRAKLTLEKIFKKYSDLHLQLADKPQVTQIFTEQSDSYSQKLNEATEALKRFDAQNGVTGAEIKVQGELLLKQFYDAQTQLGATRTEMTETFQKVAVLQRQINEQPEQIQTGSVTKYVAALDQMKGELVKLEQERTQLMQKYQANSRFVREINERIEKLKADIEREQANPPQEKSYAINDLRRRLVSDLYNSKASLAALKEREKNLAGMIERYRAQIESLNTRSIEREKLERERQQHEQAYELYLKKARESEIGQTLKKNNLLNFTLVDPPYSNSTPVNPKPFLNLMALLGVGLFAGVICALLIEKASEQVAQNLILSGRDIEERYQLPVLAVIPTIEAPKPNKQIPPKTKRRYKSSFAGKVKRYLLK
jgi:uncharacterized protein involved in exopolysaccharide biosynthesis